MFRQSMLSFAIFLTFLSLLSAEETAEQAETLSSAEGELVALIEAFDDELNVFWSQSRGIEDDEENANFRKEHDPAIKYLPKLLEFEKDYRGQNVGIDALRKIANYAGRGGLADSPGVIARREALKRLGTYEDRIQLGRLVGRLTNGRYDPLVVDYLRELGASQKAHPTVSATGRFYLAKSLLNQRSSRQVYEGYLQQIADGIKPKVPNAEVYIREMLDALPSENELDAGGEEAVALLSKLAESGDAYQLPEIRGKDPRWRIRVIDTESTKPARYLSKVAAALLFKEQHLSVGREAPSLEFELVDGKSWTSEAVRGQVVVIQFSFTGCGPCKAMYPLLHELHAAYPEQVSVLSIMRDETDEHIKNAVQTGEMTWNIAWDGNPGRIASAWAVDGFPTVYVIDQQGKIVAKDLRDDNLRAKVAELVGAEE